MNQQKSDQKKYDSQASDYIFYLYENKKYLAYKLIFIFTIALSVSLYLPDTFRSSAIVSSKTDDGISSSSIAGTLGQLGSIGGISISSDDLSTRDRVIATLKSYTFFEYIYSNNKFSINLMAVSGYNENSSLINTKIYDINKSSWVEKKTHPQIAYEKYKKVLAISENSFKPIFTISISSPSPYAAEEMTTFILDRINKYIKIKDIRESKRAIKYLEEEIQKATIPDIREALSSMVIQYMAKLVTAEKSDQYLFDIIQAPYISLKKSDPQRIILFVKIFLAGAFAVLIYFFFLFSFKISPYFSILNTSKSYQNE